MSAIEWLKEPAAPANVIPPTVLLEPPVTENGQGPSVTVTPLEQQLPPLGLVSSAVTGLPIDLWQNSPPDLLATRLRQTPARGLPAMQSLLLTLLLTDARPAPQAGDKILLARLDRLMDIGAVDPALALVQEAGPGKTPERFKRWFEATLLTGEESRSCAMLTARPYLDRDYRARIYCAVRRGDWPTASLILESGLALGVFDDTERELLDRFVNPEFYEDEATRLPPPQRPDPLALRLYEAIGEPHPTTALPRAYAHADLRDIAGWKAQLEAAERLTRSGAMNPNLLLGLFTQRRPAASGGIWDRVAAVQALDSALRNTAASGKTDPVARALPALWTAARDAGLELAMADLFAPALAKLPLTGDAALLSWKLQLLSAGYEVARAPEGAKDGAFLSAVAQGVPDADQAPSQQAAAIARGFSDAVELPMAQGLLLSENRLGEAILITMESFAHGSEGNLSALTQSIAALRLIGLEDTARRAALQLLLLEDR
ncbi:hypothetical protein TRM7557_03741 [Tritonibacter multivorans]|uniref:Uncharacterized protein n=1 Tax=Tritonibacter multivorans TaxID=928856 RepID=A0A0P1GJ23_9RHOB|nr:hypothetical protein [Tritonibacter multivorans]MDA7421612.1 hypothetical protein [Tritonibacter multivorans]CUH82083.1 hypothetical protein TRM7557_03741 [Tritonibacter multivorans]SFC93904.1 hypothetical protein SAMN04488049_10587 [Tritonibacter multivorans]